MLFRSYLKVGNAVDMDTIQELVDRRGGSPSGKGKLLQVESKDVYKSRGNKSPDKADAVTMLVQCARLSNTMKPKSPDTNELPDEDGIRDNPKAFTLTMSTPMDMGFSTKLPKEFAIHKD